MALFLEQLIIVNGTKDLVSDLCRGTRSRAIRRRALSL